MPTKKPAAPRRAAKKSAAKPTQPDPATKTLAETTKALATTGVKVSEAARNRAEALLKEIARRKERIAEDFYDIGLALQQIARQKLYVALGHRSFDEMLKSRNVLSPTTARSLIQLVSTMSREEAITYGQEKAIALLSYVKATPEVDTPKTLMEGGQLPDGKPVASASVRDLKNAAKRVRASTGTSKSPSSEAKAAEAEAKAVAKWLRDRGAKKPTVTTTRTKDGYLLRVELPVAAWAGVRSS